MIELAPKVKEALMNILIYIMIIKEFLMNTEIKLNIEEVDENNLFLTILKNDKNLVSELEICQFSNEMEYWGYPIKLFKYNNIYGYLFTKELDKDDLLFEVERIIKKYKLDA